MRNVTLFYDIFSTLFNEPKVFYLYYLKYKCITKNNIELIKKFNNNSNNNTSYNNNKTHTILSVILPSIAKYETKRFWGSV